MSHLLLNEVFLSIYNKDGYFTLSYYSFNEEGLYFKDKFTDNTLNYENLLSFVRQLRPTFCLLNLNSKLEVYHSLADALNELFLIDQIDNLDDESISEAPYEVNPFTSIKKCDQTNNRMFFNLNQCSVSQSLSNQTSQQNTKQASLQNDLISTTINNNQNNTRVLFLPNKYYNIDQCKSAILECDYHKANIFTENDKCIFISSILNLADDSLIKSIGSLLIYINQHKLGIRDDGKGLSVLKFERFVCEGYVNIDQITLNELNVFAYKDHPSIFKKDCMKKDDSSLFSLFNKCKSSYGSNYMRRLFFRPLSNYEKLNNQLSDVEELMNLSKDVIYFYYSCLKKIKSINNIVEKMKIMVLNLKQLTTLIETVENLITINQFVQQQQQQTSKLRIYYKIREYYPVELEQIMNDIKVVINLDKSLEDKKIEINPDVNKELDQMKLEFENIQDILTIATEYEQNSKLIDFIPNFQIIFSPIFGFVIQVYHKDLVDEKKMLLTLKDIEYISTTDKYKYFKTKNLKQYDESYSSLLADIQCKHNLILLDLQDGILKRFPKVFRFLEVIGELDCLLRFAQIAKLYNYVRPTFNFSNVIRIENGRHPLKENSFVPNDYLSEYPKSIKILTGANNSGKTVYLKQNCLIIFMAYLGSFVPADFCNIPLFSKILTKIETIESMSTGLSSFTNDLCRLSNIIYKIPYNSLVVIDEFGKGTNYEDGLSIFAAYINFIIQENPKSHYMISTHIHSLPDFLERNNQISYQQMEVKFENNEIFYTYRLIDGFAEFSFPLELGKKIKFDPLILKRANHIKEIYKKDISSFKEMATYIPGELDKVNEILEQIIIVDKIDELLEGIDVEMSTSSIRGDQEME